MDGRRQLRGKGILRYLALAVSGPDDRRWECRRGRDGKEGAVIAKFSKPPGDEWLCPPVDAGAVARVNCGEKVHPELANLLGKAALDW